MSWERCVLPLCVGFLVCTSCSGDDSPPGNNATGGTSSAAGQSGAPGGETSSEAGTSAGGSSSGGTKSQGGSAAGDAGSSTHGVAGAAGAGCQGDAKRWAEITAAPPQCKTADDCCVVVNTCLAEAQVVGAKDFDAAQMAWPYCDADCNDCIAPAIVVSCDKGKCVGTADVESGDEGVSHCGDTSNVGGAPGQSFSCQ